MNVLIADDQKLLRESFKSIIENNSDFKVIGSVKNGKEAYDFCGENKPDLILMDLIMPDCNGAEATKMIKAKYPDIKVLILSSSSEGSDVEQAIENGADGYILKDVGTSGLILSLKSVVAGLGIISRDIMEAVPLKTNQDRRQKKSVMVNGFEVLLSDRELKIIEMIVDGSDNKQISAALFLAEGTVKNSITEIISKLQVKDRTQLAVFAVKNSLV